jgi:hypothetical protein
VSRHAARAAGVPVVIDLSFMCGLGLAFSICGFALTLTVVHARLK